MKLYPISIEKLFRITLDERKKFKERSNFPNPYNAKVDVIFFETNVNWCHYVRISVTPYIRISFLILYYRWWFRQFFSHLGKMQNRIIANRFFSSAIVPTIPTLRIILNHTKIIKKYKEEKSWTIPPLASIFFI